jgi:O-antigen ligase
VYYSSGPEDAKSVLYYASLKNALKSASTCINIANVVGFLAAIVTLLCLLALPSANYWNIRLPIYLLIVVWTTLRPQAALYLTPIAVPWGSLDTANLGGLHLADILTMLLAASWLMSFAFRQHATREIAAAPFRPLDHDASTPPRYLVLAILALLLAMLASMTVTISLSLSIKELVKWLEVLVIVALGTHYLRTRRQIWLLVVIICLVAISQAIFGYIQYFFDIGPTAFIRDASLRVYGTFDQPNPYAGYINMALTITLALWLLGKGLSMRIAAAITTILLLGVELLSQSKGGWLALAVSVLFIIIIGLPRIRLFVLGLVIALLNLIASYLAGLIPESLLTPVWEKAGFLRISFTEPTNDSFANSERQAHWLAGIHMFWDHPLLGVGIGNYAMAYPQYALGRFVQPLGHAHNYYINMTAEAGIFGLLAFTGFLIAIFVAGGRAYKHIHRQWMNIQAKQARPALTRTHLRRVAGNLKGCDPTATLNAVRATSRVAALRNNVEKLQAQRYAYMLTNDRALAIGILASLISVCVHNIVDNLYVHSMTNLFALLIVMLIRIDTVGQNENPTQARTGSQVVGGYFGRQ